VTSRTGPLPEGRIAVVRGALLLFVLLGVVESTLARSTLWGAHHYAFFPPWVLAIALPLTLVAFHPAVARRVAARGGPAERALPPWLPWLVAVLAAAVFWQFRIRHLFWGDALPLSILIPQGQAFHRDEPLSLALHQAIYQLGQGRWSGATAVAIGSTLAGAAFAGWATHWFGRLTRDRWATGLAVVVLVFQGYAPLWFGYVENYSYLALALLLFCTTGVDAIEGRGPTWAPLLAAAAAFGFHLIGGLTVVPAAILVARRAREPRGRRELALTLLAFAVAGLLAAWILAQRLGADSPFSRFPALARAVLTDARAITPSFLFSPRHLRDVWSEFVLLGPLSAPLVALLVGGLAGRLPAGRTAALAFAVAGSVAFVVPSLLTGDGNLGPARNWDLFAAPGVVVAFTGVLALLLGTDRAQARRLLLAVAAVSLFHALPWVALNASFERTVARVLVLPLGLGRNAMMLGTHHLNAGEHDQAARWFARAVAEDSLNANSQSGLGVSLARRGAYGAALGPMEAAVRLRPNVAQYRKDLGALLLTLDQCARAVAEWEAARGLEPGAAGNWAGLAFALRCAGEPERAVAAAEEGLRRFPEDGALRAELAAAYDRWVATLGAQGRLAEARSALAAFAARFPADPRVAVLRRALDEAGAPP
jgi:Flp pilus assembly protein TadD